MDHDIEVIPHRNIRVVAQILQKPFLLAILLLLLEDQPLLQVFHPLNRNFAGFLHVELQHDSVALVLFRKGDRFRSHRERHPLEYISNEAFFELVLLDFGEPVG